MGLRLDIREEDRGFRLDKWLSIRFPEFSRQDWKKEISGGQILVNGQPANPSRVLAEGDLILIQNLPDRGEETPRPQDIPLPVLYEDQWLAIIDKPAGLAVHPSQGHASGTLVNAALARYPGRLSDWAGSDRPGIVHRLDKDTSGAMLIALDNETHGKLAALFRAGTIGRFYQAVVRGQPSVSRGLIDVPIGRGDVNRRRMEVKADGRASRTEFEVLGHSPGTARLQLRLLTGRTHQIRVHLAYIGHPVVGDRLYGGRKSPGDPPYQLLHATGLSFTHPVTGEDLDCQSPLPDRFAPFLSQEVQP